MAATPPADITTETLEGLLREAGDGRIQIPEFQRTVVLTDDWITSLLASVSLNYPIGAVMLLEAGNPDVRFQSRPVAGSESPSTQPERLLLDGQQRLTALFQVLASDGGAHTHDDHGEPVRRWYYVDIRAALDPAGDRDEAIVSVPTTGPVRTPQEDGLGTPESEWEGGLFPLRLVFGDVGVRRRWHRGFVGHGPTEGRAARQQLMDRFEADVLHAFEHYLVPTILLPQETARWSVRVHGGPDGRSLSDRFRSTS